MAFDTSARRMDIYELARSDSMGHRVDWSCEISYGDHLYQVGWICYFPKDKEESPYGHWLLVWKNGEKVDDMSDQGRMIMESVSALRANELKHPRNSSPSETEILDRFVHLADKALNGEFIGQRSLTYLNDIGRVLGIPEYLAIEYGYKLRDQGKIGLSGFILISPERDAESRRRLEARTGHKDYDMSDMGEMWWCRYCGNKADLREGPSPQEVPCVRVDSH